MKTTTQFHPGRAAFAGFTAGYVMALAGYWLEAVFGVSELDFAHAGLRYVSGGKQGWWIIGIIFHLIDSALLGLLYGAVAYRALRRLTRSLGSFWGNVAAGLAFASGIWLTLAMLIAMPFMGSGIFGWKTGSARPALASLLLHLIFGSLLGSIYGFRSR
ncbi:MAG TPA: hypothetical protein VKX96_09040 [Chloroflexota bacterium]|jgi:hypothetical protein|nr:hypothetical protein [Chloroflexota bacterium]